MPSIMQSAALPSPSSLRSGENLKALTIIDEEPHHRQIVAGSRAMKRGPAVRVLRVHVAPQFYQESRSIHSLKLQFHHARM